MNFQKRKLKNGIIVLHEKRDLPVVSFGISNPFAASHETSDIKGIAHFIEHLLFTGTSTRTHEDISREIEKKGGILNAFTAQDVTSYWFKLPSEHLTSGMDIIIDMLKNPKFDEEKFEKEKKVILEEIKMYHDMPQRHVFEKIEENLYEKPFGEGVIGSKETVSKMTRDFVKEYFEKKYSPENYIVTLVGNADFDKVCDYLENQFSPENKQTNALEIKRKNAETTEEREGIDQAHFVFAMHAPESTSEKRYHLETLHSYLASGMSSKLFLEIREKRGLAYSVRGSINSEKNYSYYSIYVGTTKEAIPEVKKLILEEFSKVEEMTEKDLEESKERLIGLKKVSSEEGVNVMNELLFEEVSTGKAENCYKFEEEIKKVKLENVKSLAKELVKEYSTAAIVPK
jgi:predicted Zn-dependent peptidase